MRAAAAGNDFAGSDPAFGEGAPTAFGGASGRLTFSPNCGSHAAVMNQGVTAHRPNAADDFNFGVVLTSRPLKANEIFEVRLDKMVTKWAGSIEIGNKDP